eukprot:CAMPEP_0206438444 /NCGR_PEP_ID=MMETSP0324_2-20121206/11633_1 /ASSEMBLY_ACC=CAM_ASM_000836 /TAXON_ID=2866 /ORGANISM="Crypthecodinium cohnii, Strain Seligo" /LENGTH=127 /DNA_ID=CAMNT_0053905903 /DNA_START=1187 /DNA_END=1571 /DNA_ORIENTATION=+
MASGGGVEGGLGLLPVPAPGGVGPTPLDFFPGPDPGGLGIPFELWKNSPGPDAGGLGACAELFSGADAGGLGVVFELLAEAVFLQAAEALRRVASLQTSSEARAQPFVVFVPLASRLEASHNRPSLA